MTKRSFRDVAYEKEMTRQEYTTNKRFHLKKYKNSLDSDEEDDEEEAMKLNVLDPRHLEGEEDGTIDFDGEIKITPFNMKEELEEGHFDKDGTYIFHSDRDEIKDNWLDNIDWVKVQDQKSIKRKHREESEDEDEEEIDVMGVYREMLELMQPKESVQRAIKRLAGGGVSASKKWIKKKRSAESPSVSDEDREKCTLLTGLADKIIMTGDMDIYQQTYERLQHLLNRGDGKDQEDPAQEKEPLDMFADEVDASKLNNPTTVESAAAAGEGDAVTSEVMWEFKWEKEDAAPIYGPHPTSEMQRWVDEGYFEGEVLVRRVGQADNQFYSSKRIDFELYM